MAAPGVVVDLVFDEDELPHEIEGIALSDDKVQIAVTPLSDLAHSAARTVTTVAVVDDVSSVVDELSTDRCRFSVTLRSGPSDAAILTFYGGAVLTYRGVVREAVALIVRAKCSVDGGVVTLFVSGDGHAIAVVPDAVVARVDAARIRRGHGDWTAAACERAAQNKLAALRRQREKAGAWRSAADAASAVCWDRCWRCGDAWGRDGACLSWPACGGRRPAAGGARAAAGAPAVAVELVDELRRCRLRVLRPPRGEVTVAQEGAAEPPRDVAAALLAGLASGGDHYFDVGALDAVRARLRAAAGNGEVRGWREPPASVLALARAVAVAGDAAAPGLGWESAAAVEARELKIPPALLARLAPFQREGVRFCLRRRRCYIADEMGAGKTLQAIAAAAAHRDDGWPLLVVCPAGLRGMWAEEVERWIPDVRPADIRVVRSARDAPPPPPAPPPRIMIISFCMLERLRELGADGPFEWPSVIVDEAQALETKSSKLARRGQRHESAQARRALDLVRKASRLAILLSGTPAMLRPASLFGALDALARGGDAAARGNVQAWLLAKDYGDRKLNFARAWCGARKVHHKPGRLRYDAIRFDDELHALLRGVWMIRRLKRDVLSQLPRLRRCVVRIGASAPWRKRPDGDEEAGPAVIARGHRHGASAGTAMAESGLAKVDDAASWIIERLVSRRRAPPQSSKLVVFAHHVAVIDALLAALEACRRDPKLSARGDARSCAGGSPEARGGGDDDDSSDDEFVATCWYGEPVLRLDGAADPLDREATVRLMRDRAQRRVVLVSVTAGGIGLDLSSCSDAVFVEAVGLEAAWLRQAEDRLHRRGQRGAVRIYYLLGAAGAWDDSGWPKLHASLKANSSVMNGAGDAERFDVVRVLEQDASQSAMASQPGAAAEVPAGPDDGTDDGSGGGGDVADWQWACDADSDELDEDDTRALWFEVSPHTARVHVHGAPGGDHLGCSFDRAQIEVVRAAARDARAAPRRGGARAARAAAQGVLPARVRASGLDARAAWRFCRDWAALTPRQRAHLAHVAARSPLSTAVARAATAAAAAAAGAATTTRYTPAAELLRVAEFHAGCDVRYVRVASREQQGLPPLAQSIRPVDGSAKCLVCPNFFACAPGDDIRQTIAELFCGAACRDAYTAKTSGGGLRRVVFARDGGVCAGCGADGHALVERLRASSHVTHGRRYTLVIKANARWGAYPTALRKLLDHPAAGLAWEADHVRRVADGGGEATADDVQTLCVPCHRAKTKQEAVDAAAARRKAADKRTNSPPPRPRGGRKTDAARSPTPPLPAPPHDAARTPAPCKRGRPADDDDDFLDVDTGLR